MAHPLLQLGLLFIFSSTAFADTFKCEVNGTVSYSDKPCANAQILQFPEYKPAKQNGNQKPLSVKEKYHQLNFKLEAARKKRAYQRQIKSLDLQIEETEQARQRALKALRKDIDALDFSSNDIDDMVFVEEQERVLKAQIERVDNDYQQQLKTLQAEKHALQKKIEGIDPRQ